MNFQIGANHGPTWQPRTQVTKRRLPQIIYSLSDHFCLRNERSRPLALLSRNFYCGSEERADVQEPLVGLRRRQVFRLLRNLNRMAPPACRPSVVADQAIIGFRLRFARWRGRGIFCIATSVPVRPCCNPGG
jgi:hypothetical protein